MIATPQISHHTLGDEARFIILASDGVWEFIDNEKAVAIVDAFYSTGRPAEEVTCDGVTV